MHIDWTHFTPWSAVVGGLLIGAAAGLYLLGNGRIAGIAGIVAGPLQALTGAGKSAGRTSSSAFWRAQAPRLLFIAGLLVAPWIWRLFAALPASTVDVGPPALIAAGMLAGVGVRLGNGCTSGHGVCGLSRFSIRSLANVLAFMGAGFAMVFVLRHVL
jgi:uncharacterized protein